MGACFHPRAGICTNQPGSYDERRIHAWRACCENPACIEYTLAWVKAITKEPATAIFRPDNNGEWYDQ